MPDDLYHSDILGWSKAQADVCAGCGVANG